MSAGESQIQLDKFKQAARELEAGDDPSALRSTWGTPVKHKQVEKKLNLEAFLLHARIVR